LNMGCSRRKRDATRLTWRHITPHENNQPFSRQEVWIA